MFDHLRVTEEKPPLINQQCDLCDTNCIGYTCRHLHQRVEEHKHFVIGKHFRDVHGLTPDNLIENFKVIKKCRGKFDCLIHEMLWIKNKRPIETEHASGFHSHETLYLSECFHAFMLIYFLSFNIYKYAFPLFLIHSFDNDDMKSSKRHVVLLSLVFLPNCFSFLDY